MMTTRTWTVLARALRNPRQRRRAALVALVAAAAMAVVAQARGLPRPSPQPATPPTARFVHATAVHAHRADLLAPEVSPPSADVLVEAAIEPPAPNADVARAALQGGIVRSADPTLAKAPRERRTRRRRPERIENHCARNDPLCGLGPNRFPQARSRRRSGR